LVALKNKIDLWQSKRKKIIRKSVSVNLQASRI